MRIIALMREHSSGDPLRSTADWYEAVKTMSQELQTHAPTFSLHGVSTSTEFRKELSRYVKEIGLGGAIRLPVSLAYWLGQMGIAALSEMGYLHHLADISPYIVLSAVVAALASNNIAAYYLLKEGASPVNINAFFANKILDLLGERTNTKCTVAVIVCNIDQIIIELNKLGVIIFNPALYNGMSLFIACGVGVEGLVNTTRLVFLCRNSQKETQELTNS